MLVLTPVSHPIAANLVPSAVLVIDCVDYRTHHSLSSERIPVSLSEIDSQLLEHCLADSPRAWKNFVDRFLGLVVHVAHHTAQCRSLRLTEDLRDDLVCEVFSVIVADKYAVLRRFQRNCSLATYLSVIARRVIVRRLYAMASQPTNGSVALDRLSRDDGDIARVDNADEVNRLILRLDPQEAQVVRMYHLQGMTYQQIGHALGLSENSVGPVLTRARSKMRQQ